MEQDGLRPLRVYFQTSCKDRCVTLSVDHPWATESLTIPLHPSNAVPDVLDLLEPAIAHYVAQWERFLVPQDGDYVESDCLGFWVPAGGMPAHIAPPRCWSQIDDVCWSHLDHGLKDWYGSRDGWRAICAWDPTVLMHGNIDDVVVEAADLGIEPWVG